MKKNIKDYLHLYFGCDIFIPAKAEGEKDSIMFLNWKKFEYDLSDVKLLLRPLSDMTEEVMKELWHLIFKRQFIGNNIRFIKERTHYTEPRWVLSSGVERLGIELNGNVWADSDLHHYKFNPNEVTKFLLSKGFDLFNLIPEGLALDKTKIESYNKFKDRLDSEAWQHADNDT